MPERAQDASHSKKEQQGTPVHHDSDPEIPRLSFWRSTKGQFPHFSSGLARGRVPQVLAV